jgi:hypothetical protein
MKGVSNNLQFLKVPPGKYTNNDQRFYYYHTFLKNNLFDSVFITDLWDVQCRIDPSTLNTNEFDLFFCKDSIKLSDYDFNGFKYFDAHKIYNWENCKDFLEKKYDLLNMGVIGGSYKNIMMFLEYFKKHRDEIFTKYNDQRNINMIIGNYIARKYFNNILAGFPFCSEFKKFENRDDVYFIHK